MNQTGRIGQFEIRAQLGEGGSGRVDIAQDTVLDREVAIKSLRPELLHDKSFVERFRTEARNLARLSHPNITTLYTLHEEAGSLYMIMELVRGRTLETILKERTTPFTVQEALAVVAQAADGLAYAHQMGVVHRDIKPANLILTDTGLLKIMDFGIARVQGSQRMTRDGSVIGTVAYMSPEQCRGQDVDGRTDQYSLAIVLYELLTRDVPFSSPSDFTLMQAHVSTAPEAPSRRVQGIPPHVEKALMKALSKRREDRFASLSEFKDALGAPASRTEAIGIVHNVTRLIGAPVTPAMPKVLTAASSRMTEALGKGSLGFTLKAVALGAGAAILVAALAFLIWPPAPPPVVADLSHAKTAIDPSASSGGQPDKWGDDKIIRKAGDSSSRAAAQAQNYNFVPSPADQNASQTASPGPPKSGPSGAPRAPFEVAAEPNGAGAAAPVAQAPRRPAAEPTTSQSTTSQPTASLAESRPETAPRPASSVEAAAAKPEVAPRPTAPADAAAPKPDTATQPAATQVATAKPEATPQAAAPQVAAPQPATTQPASGVTVANARPDAVPQPVSSPDTASAKPGGAPRPAAEQRGRAADEVTAAYEAKDFDKARQKAEACARDSDSECQFILGRLFENGLGGAPKDPSTAADWYRKSAEAGNQKAAYNLGVLYYRGDGVPKNPSEAAEWFTKAAYKSDARAQLYLAILYESGEGVPKDLSQARRWYAELAKSSDPELASRGREALDKLGGRRVVEATLTPPVSDATPAKPDAAPQPAAEHRSGAADEVTAAYEAKDFDKARQKAEPCAKDADAECEFVLGRLFENGLGGEQKDPSTAAEWYRKSAEAGNPKAAYDLGVLYYRGDGVPKNMSSAAEWFTKAAYKNHADAQLYLATLYEHGEGVPRDLGMARHWYGELAKSSDPQASTRGREALDRLGRR